MVARVVKVVHLSAMSPARAPSRSAIEALLDKYREMRRMRAEDAAGLVIDPKPEMRALAARFPGALREIDETALDRIEARIGELEAVLRAESEAPEWARYAVDYHAWLRAALRIKRMCVGCATVADAVARARASYAPEEDEPSFEAIGEAGIVAIVRPERGRLNPWVYARVAELHGVTPDDVRLALFAR